jgi:CheY-like chemotaxis protein
MKFGTFLLVDDYCADNYANRRLIGAASMVEDIQECVSTDAALAYLRSPERPRIDLILVDINMPRKSGFQFADEYHELSPRLKAGTLVVMLSASLNLNDQRRAESHPAIDGFMQKPVIVPELRNFLAKFENRAGLAVSANAGLPRRPDCRWPQRALR